MRKSKKVVEIVTSSNRRLSSISKTSYSSVLKSLSKTYSNVSVSLIDNEKDLQELIARRPDVVFLCMKKVPKNPGHAGSEQFVWLADVLDTAGISYTGSVSTSARLDDNKHDGKKVIAKAGLPTAKFFMGYTGQYTNGSHLPLPYPLFMKPPDFGGGEGIDNDSVVHDYRSYKRKLKSLESSLDSEALVEEYLQGREFTVAVLRNAYSGEYRVACAELIAPENKTGQRILTKNVKNDDAEIHQAVSDSELTEKLSTLTLEIFHALGARDYGRIDFRMDEHDEPQFLESNLIPSLLEGYGNFQKICSRQFGLSYDEMLLQILGLGLNRETEESLTPAESIPSLAVVPAPA